MSTTVLMVLLTNEYPPDVRVEGEIKALQKQGYRVILINKRSKRDRWEDFEGVRILRLPSPRSFFLRLILHTFLLTFLIPLICGLYNIKLIHVHDLLDSIPVVFIAAVYRCKVIVDLHEDYIGALDVYIKKREDIIKKFLLKNWLNIINYLERVTVHLSTAIITVSREGEKRIIRMGVPKERSIYLQNIMTIAKIKKMSQNNVVKDKDTRYTISYIGGFSPHRGLETLMNSIPIMLEKEKNINVLFVGDGLVSNELRKLSKELKIVDHVTFTGWVPFDNAMSYMNNTDVFVIPYIRSRQTDPALPHKLFQAMYLGKCLVVSDVPAMKEIVIQNQCGLVFKAGSHEDLAMKIIKLIENPYLIEYFGKNGIKAVNEIYSWTKESSKLIRLYEKTLSNLA